MRGLIKADFHIHIYSGMIDSFSLFVLEYNGEVTRVIIDMNLRWTVDCKYITGSHPLMAAVTVAHCACCVD